jgi:hypothetical protein
MADGIHDPGYAPDDQTRSVVQDVETGGRVAHTRDESVCLRCRHARRIEQQTTTPASSKRAR